MVGGMTPTVRRIRDEELPAYADAIATGFVSRPDLGLLTQTFREIWGLDRLFAAFDGDRLCGTFRTWATELTLPGLARLPAAAVAAVTVLPTHRRRGILRQMVAAGHAAARDAGEPIAMLYASEYPIYGRFGYGPATQDGTWTLDVRATGFAGARPAAGTIELIPPTTDAIPVLEAVFDARRRSQPGELARQKARWEFNLGLRPSVWDPDWKGFLVVHRSGDRGEAEVDGYARYRVEMSWEQRQPRCRLTLDDLQAGSEAATADLWRYLAEVDLVTTVKADGRSPADVLPWLLTNPRAAQLANVGDGLWVRLLDVPRALEARGYERSDCLRLEVVDAEAPGGRLRIELDAGPGGASCRPTTERADLTIGVGALGAAYLGGTSLRQAVAAGGADEHSTGALSRADALFRTLEPPFCSTHF
jgi:predicted acetyltransferase